MGAFRFGQTSGNRFIYRFEPSVVYLSFLSPSSPSHRLIHPHTLPQYIEYKFTVITHTISLREFPRQKAKHAFQQISNAPRLRPRYQRRRHIAQAMVKGRSVLVY